MADTLESRLDEVSTAIFWFIRISGIPYLFCAGEVPPALITGTRANGRPYLRWGGQTYDWLTCLIWGDDVGQVGQQMQPKGGMPQSGGMTFRIRVDDPIDGNFTGEDSTWLKLLQRAIKGRTDGVKTANLADSIQVDSTGINLTFLSNPWEGDAGNLNLYLGLETVIVDDDTDTSTERGLLDVRGAYGSTPLHHQHVEQTDDESHASGLIVSDFPLVWEGRVIELYASLGHWIMDDHANNMHLGRFETYGRQDGADLTLSEPNTVLMDRFVLTNVREGGDNASVNFEAGGLDGLIDGDILARAPTAKCGLGPDQGWSSDGVQRLVYIGSHNWQFTLIVRSDHLRLPLSLMVVDHGSIADGDTFEWEYPGGSLLLTAKTTPVSLDQFAIGADADAFIDNVRDKLENYSGAATWRTHYGWPASGVIEPDDYTLNFEFVSREGGADESFALTASNPTGANFSQPNTVAVGIALYNQRLRYWNGSGYANVAEGLYDPSVLGNFLRETVTEYMYGEGLLPSHNPAVSAWSPGAPSIHITRETRDDGEWSNKWVLSMSLLGLPFVGTAFDWFTRYSGKESFLRDLGFTDDAYFVDSEIFGRVTASKSPAAFRWPRRGYQRPGRLYLYDMGQIDVENMTAAYLHFDDVGTGLCAGIIDAVDCITFSEGNFSAWSSPYAAAGFYIAVDQSDFYGWGADDEVYYEIVNPRGEKEQKIPSFERVVLFKNGVAAAKGILQLLIGGSGVEGTLDATYDVGWRGCGLAIPGEYFDLPTFEQHADAGLEKRYYCIRKGDKIRELLDNECKLGQFQICADRGKLYLATTRPLMASDEVDAFVIDASNLVTDLKGSGIGFDRAENRIVNVIDVQADYNPVTKDFGLKIPMLRSDSISTWGKKEPMALQIRANPGAQGGVIVARRLANRVFGAYALPYAVIEVYLSTPRAWLLRCGDDVVLTSPVIPSPTDATRGVTALPCRIFGRDKHYMAGGQGTARYFAKLVLIARAYGGGRWGRVAPSAYMTGYKGGGGSGVGVVITQSLYASTGVNDNSHFEAGMIVTLYSIADGTTVNREIALMPNATELEFTSSTSIAAPCLIIFAQWGSAVDSQKKFAYLCDGESIGAGNEAPYLYP